MFLAVGLLVSKPNTTRADIAPLDPAYDVLYQGSAIVTETPDLGAPPLPGGKHGPLVAYGKLVIDVHWTAEGIGDVSDPNFRLNFTSLFGSVQLNHEGAPPELQPVPPPCAVNLEQVPGTTLRVRYFPPGTLTSDFLHHGTLHGFPDDAEEEPSVPAPDQYALLPEFPILADYLQEAGTGPEGTAPVAECQPNLGLFWWEGMRDRPPNPPQYGLPLLVNTDVSLFLWANATQPYIYWYPGATQADREVGLGTTVLPHFAASYEGPRYGRVGPPDGPPGLQIKGTYKLEIDSFTSITPVESALSGAPDLRGSSGRACLASTAASCRPGAGAIGEPACGRAWCEVHAAGWPAALEPAWREAAGLMLRLVVS